MVTEVSAVAFRQNLGEMLNQVQYRKDSIVVNKDGKPVAALARGTAGHNAMLGRRVPHPASTRFRDDEIGPTAKRLKTVESTDDDDSRDVSDDEEAIQVPNEYRDEILDSEDEDGLEDEAKAEIEPSDGIGECFTASQDRQGGN